MPKKQLHTHLPSLFAVSRESRELCKFIFVAFGPTFIHPRLDTLYISLYAVGRMRTTELEITRGETYPVKAFDKVAIEYGVKNLYKGFDLGEWREKPGKWQVRHGVRDFCKQGIWPATDYAEFFRCFGMPREVLLVSNGELRWTGGFSKLGSWRIIEFVATEMEKSHREMLVQLLRMELRSELIGEGMGLTVVDAKKEDFAFFACPYGWRELCDWTERYMWM